MCVVHQEAPQPWPLCSEALSVCPVFNPRLFTVFELLPQEPAARLFTAFYPNEEPFSLRLSRVFPLRCCFNVLLWSFSFHWTTLKPVVFLKIWFRCNKSLLWILNCVWNLASFVWTCFLVLIHSGSCPGFQWIFWIILQI